MKPQVEKSGKNRSLGHLPATRTRLVEAAPAGFGADTETLDEISGGSIPARSCLHQHCEHKGGEILGD